MTCEKCLAFINDAWDEISHRETTPYIKNPLGFERYSREILSIVVRICITLLSAKHEEYDAEVIKALQLVARPEIEIGDLRKMDNYYMSYSVVCYENKKMKEDIEFLYDYLKDKNLIYSGLEALYMGKLLVAYHIALDTIHREHLGQIG